MYLWARLFSTALPAGEDYSALPRTITLSIVNFLMFPCVEYISEFGALEVTRHTFLTDKMGMRFFELPKLPNVVNKGDILLLWLSLFKANTEEELKKIYELGVPEMQQAIDAYRDTVIAPEFREMVRLREKARHDEAQALYNAERKGKMEGIAEGEMSKAFFIATNMLRRNRPINEIIEDTGLSYDEVKGIKAD